MPWPFSESIKKRACRYLLHRYLGNFLQEKLSLDQLSVDLYQGKGSLAQVPLDKWVSVCVMGGNVTTWCHYACKLSAALLWLWHIHTHTQNKLIWLVTLRDIPAVTEWNPGVGGCSIWSDRGLHPGHFPHCTMGFVTSGQLCSGSQRLGNGFQAKASHGWVSRLVHHWKSKYWTLR